MRDVWICEAYYFAEAFRAKKIQLTNHNVAFEASGADWHEKLTALFDSTFDVSGRQQKSPYVLVASKQFQIPCEQPRRSRGTLVSQNNGVVGNVSGFSNLPFHLLSGQKCTERVVIKRLEGNSKRLTDGPSFFVGWVCEKCISFPFQTGVVYRGPHPATPKLENHTSLFPNHNFYKRRQTTITQ